MQKAFIVLEQAKREAEARLRKATEEGRKSAYKLPSIRGDIRELEQALAALKYMHDERLKLVRLWAAVEQGSREHVQKIPSGGAGGRRRNQAASNRGRRRT